MNNKFFDIFVTYQVALASLSVTDYFSATFNPDMRTYLFFFFAPFIYITFILTVFACLKVLNNIRQSKSTDSARLRSPLSATTGRS
jgi:hypothetical protein